MQVKTPLARNNLACSEWISFRDPPIDFELKSIVIDFELKSIALILNLRVLLLRPLL